MSGALSHIAARIVGRPLLILPAKLDVIAQVLAGRIGLEVDKPELGLEIPQRPDPIASRFVGTDRDRDTGGLPYRRTEAGAALITITGSLVNRGAYIGASMSGLASYEGIAAQVRAALADPKVSSLLLDIDSPGGEATGAFELADMIRAANDAKPVTAFVNGLAASAGYAIASGARRIVSVPSGVTGSIGIVMLHADLSRALAAAGVTTTFIHAGAHKVDGNPYEPLSPDVKASLQAEVDQLYALFIGKVAAGRGRRMSAKAIRDTEARTFFGAEAKAIGLVDEVATFEELYDDMNRSGARNGGRSSTGKTRSTAMFTKDDLDKAAAEATVAERTRCAAILRSAEAKNREASAMQLCFDTDMAAATAVTFLATIPQGSSLDARMRSGTAGFHTAGTDQVRQPSKIDAGAIYARFNNPKGG